MRRRSRRGVRALVHGQAATEYILLVGVLVLVLIVALVYYSDRVKGFIDDTGAWLDDSSRELPPAASSPPPKPPATPAEPVKTMTDDDWVDWLEGTWCAPGNNWVVRRSGPGTVIAYRVYPDGTQSEPQTVKITSLGPDGFRETTAEDPNWWVNDTRLSDNSWKIAARADGYSGGIFTRC